MGLPVPPSDGPDHLALRLSKYQICVRPPPPTTCLAEPRRPPARSVPVTEVSDFARRWCCFEFRRSGDYRTACLWGIAGEGRWAV